MSKIILITTLLFIAATAGFSQDNCKNALYEADKLYEAGKIKECIEKLEACLNVKKDKNELIETYHLLALSYHTLNDQAKTDTYIRKLLKLKPDYQKYPNIDPLDFSRLINQYTVSPLSYLGITAGFNITSIALKKSYSVFPSTQRYLPGAGYQVGLIKDQRIRPSISIIYNLSYTRFSINHIVDSAGNWEQHYNELQNYITLGVSGIKHFNLYKNLGFYTGIGAGFGSLTGANVSLDAINEESGTIQQSTKDPYSFGKELISERNSFQPFALGMVGLSYPIAQGVLSLDASYNYYFLNTVKSSTRLIDINFIFNNQYINDDIQLRPVMVNFTYKLPLRWRVEKKK